MEQYPIHQIDPYEQFPQLAELPQPPRALFARGTVDYTGKKILAIVGSRACTTYGKNVCRSLIEGLRGYPIIIVSGLALGIDSIAHQSAIDIGLTTIAFPGSSLDWPSLYPSNHRTLAESILAAGGALYAEHQEPLKGAYWVFPERNRLIAGIADMTLIIEAEHKSGTLITARLATEYNRTVGAVPGPITSPLSDGANWLLKLGAVPITDTADILRELGLAVRPIDDVREYLMLNDDEEKVVRALNEPKTRDALIDELNLTPASLAITLSTLEIKGVIRETLGLIERLL